MGTTDARLARLAIEGMVESGIRFAFLHAVEAFETGHGLSDVDIVVDRSPEEVIAVCSPAWAALGLWPVAIWPYDVGGTRTVFLVTDDASGGVQLDLLFDREGIGKYGVRSQRLLEDVVVTGGGLPVVGDAAMLVYLFQKRRRKSQRDRVLKIVERARELDRTELEAVARKVTGNTDIVAAIDGRIPPLARRRIGPILGRTVMRLRAPIGFWAHVRARGIAEEAERRFRAVLVAVASGPPGPGIEGPLWYFSRVAPLRFRAGIYVSWGSAPSFPAPDFIAESLVLEEAVRSIVTAMNQRLYS